MSGAVWQELSLFPVEQASPGSGLPDPVAAALASHWSERDGQLERHASGAAPTSGARGEVTGGGHLDPVLSLIRASVSRGPGVGEFWERGDARTILPGWFRPAKTWDLVYRDGAGVPLAAVELKSLASSFGNNLNNRVEEAVGCAADLDAAVRAGLLPRPVWKGFVFVIADCEDSRRPSRSPRAPVVDACFEGLSYVERAGVLGERLLGSGLYDGVWFVASDRAGFRDLAGSSLGGLAGALSGAVGGA